MYFATRRLSHNGIGVFEGIACELGTRQFGWVHRISRRQSAEANQTHQRHQLHPETSLIVYGNPSSLHLLILLSFFAFIHCLRCSVVTVAVITLVTRRPLLFVR